MGKPERNSTVTKQREVYTAYDRALIKCVQEGTRVTFTMATGDVISDALVISVDRFSIEVQHEGAGNIRADFTQVSEWLNKALIARTMIVRG